MSTVLSLPIDRSSPVPVYYQLVQVLEEAVRRGVLTPGAKLEKETELAARLHTSRTTVRKAVDHLVAAGVLVRRPWVGTYVASTDQPVVPCRSTPPLLRNRKPDTPHEAPSR